jgi:hypothetical protein
VGVDDEIERARRGKPVRAKDLAQDALDSVSHNRVAQFSGHGKSYAAVAQTVLEAEDRDNAPADTPALVIHRRELAA